MRPLLGGPLAQNNWWGFATNWAYIKEYGVGVIIPANNGSIYVYSAYFNAWTTLTTTNPASAPSGTYIPADYDPYQRKLVTQNLTTTYLLDFQARTWEKLTLSPSPTTAYSGTGDQWYEGYASMCFDRNSKRFIFLKDNGAETWSFDAAAKQWTQETTTGRPSNSGSMGEGLTYDRNNNVCALFSNMYDEVWTYREAAADANRLDEVKNVRGSTTAGAVMLSWDPPSVGQTPDKYYIYRSAWRRFPSTTISFDPGAYALIDSTAATTFQNTPPTTAGYFYSYTIQPAKGAIKGIMSSPIFSCRPVPMGLTATVFTRNRVGLKWVADTASDVAGYNVYRKVGAIPKNNELTKLTASPIGPRPVFIDSTVNIVDSQIVNYVVTTVNALGQESGLSPRADTRIDPVPAPWYDSTTMTLHWSPTLSDTFQEYQIWGQPIGTFDGGVAAFSRSFAGQQDTFRVVGRSLHFKVRVVNAIGQLGHFSDLVPAASIRTPTGMYRGDGMLAPPDHDPFWDRLGLSPGQVKIEQERALWSGKSPLLKISPSPCNRNAAILVDLRPLGALTKIASLSLYDMRGRLLRHFDLNAGATARIVWDGLDMKRRDAGSGTYVVRLNAGGKSVTRKIVMAR